MLLAERGGEGVEAGYAIKIIKVCVCVCVCVCACGAALSLDS